MKKYICMKERDNFVTEDEEDAYEHLRLGPDHHIVKIELEDGSFHAEVLEPEIPLEIGEEEI